MRFRSRPSSWSIGITVKVEYLDWTGLLMPFLPFFFRHLLEPFERVLFLSALGESGVVHAFLTYRVLEKMKTTRTKG